MFRYSHTLMARIVSALFLLSLLGLSGCSDEPESSAPPAPAANTTVAAVLEKALAGIGGREALVGLKGFSAEGTREIYLMGQGPQPGRGIMKLPSGGTVKASHDLAGRRLRIDTTQRFPARGGGYNTTTSTELIVGEAGYLSSEDQLGIVADTNRALSPDRTAGATKTERLLNPHMLLKKLANDPSGAALGTGEAGASPARRFAVDEVLPVTLDRVRQTGRRTLVATQEWLSGIEGSSFFEKMAEKVEVDDGWLNRWHEATALTGNHEQLVIEDDVYPITVHVDKETGRIAAMTTMEWDVVYGDVPLEATYHDWQAFDGVSFPTHVRLSVAGAPRMEVRRSQVRVNPAFGEGTFTPPAGVTYVHNEAVARRGRQVSQTLAAFGFAGVGRPQLGSIEIKPGVTLLYAAPLDGVYTLIVEQEAGLVLMETGQNDLKGEAILEWAVENYPDKPITHVIVSHHHNDHAGGIRPYVAAGATLVAHEAAVDFFAAQCARPASKIVIDALDRNPVSAKIVGVPADKLYRIDDELRPVVVYPVEMGHVSDMVFAVIEPEKILYAGDMYVSGLARDLRAGRKRPADILPFHSAVSLAEAIEMYGLDVPTLVGSHDREPVAYADLVTYVTGYE